MYISNILCIFEVFNEEIDKHYALKRDVLTILSVESKLNPDKKISEYLEQFKLILEAL